MKDWARGIKRDVHALYLAAYDPRVPWYAKAAAVCIAAYALSPIDLIPDFIPVLGYLDEVILLPLAILLVIRLIPPDIMAEHRATAAAAEWRPVSRAGAVVIVGLWIAAALLLLWLFWPQSTDASYLTDFGSNRDDLRSLHLSTGLATSSAVTL